MTKSQQINLNNLYYNTMYRPNHPTPHNECLVSVFFKALEQGFDRDDLSEWIKDNPYIQIVDK